MRPQLIMFCFGVFGVGLMMSLISTGVWFGASDIGIINALSGFSLIKVETLGGQFIPTAISTWFNALVTVVTWNYPYLNNAWGWIIKLLILYPVTIGVIVTLWQMFIQIIQGLAGMIRSIIP